MANRDKRKKKAPQQGVRGVKPSQVPKMKVIESGKAEQPAPIEGAGPTRREAIRAKEREAYRYGGTPIGSDPRE
jgi:hypothetical protein